ncbi:MAG: polysaccharide deacetylase family protein [Oscillospiraceae bacterium]
MLRMIRLRYKGLLKNAAVFTVCAAVLIACILLVRPAFAKDAAKKEKTGIFVPIIMYHSILKDAAQQGDYVLSPVVLEQDISYLKQHGYTTVFVSDLVAYVQNGTPLPEKPVVLTFDDGSYNNLVYALALLEKYDCKAVFSVVGSYTEKAAKEKTQSVSYSYLNFEDVKALAASGRVEIANHSYDLHSMDNGRRGTMRKPGEDEADYCAMLAADTAKNQALLTAQCGVTPEIYAYPYGLVCKEARCVMGQAGFAATLGVAEAPNYITRDEACLCELNRYNRPAGISTEAFMRKALGSP